MNCPNCNVTLVMSDRQGVEIDYCPQCRGVWLDRGELDKIIERSTTVENQYRSPNNNNPFDYDDDNHRRHENGYNQPYRKKSWLNDLFD